MNFQKVIYNRYIIYILYILLIYNCNSYETHNIAKNIHFKISIGTIEANGLGSEPIRKLFQEGLSQGLQEAAIDFETSNSDSIEVPAFPFEATSLFLFRGISERKSAKPTMEEIRQVSILQNSKYFIRGVIHYNRENNPEELLVVFYLYESTGKPIRSFNLIEKSPDWERIYHLGKQLAFAIKKEVNP